MQECSYCGKENDDGSTHCRECGTSLVPERTDARSSQDPVVENPQLAYSRKLMLRGAICFAGGVAVTLFSYSAAVKKPFGGQYIVATGAMAVGIVQFFRGIIAASPKDNKDGPQELLNLAAQLESKDRERAVALYAEIARKYPGTRASDEAQRNMQTLTEHKE